MKRMLVTAMAAALLSACTPSGGQRPGAVVSTDAGPVRGTVAEGYRLFQGIPFAAPPIGELRWRAPQPVQRWSQPRDATNPGGVCAQVASPLADIAGESEDCLYLNVLAPDSGKPLPTMVWVHGGGGTNGAGSYFDAHRLALGGAVVVVTTNYRLGVFGAFGYPGLAGSGTFGLADQQAALRWVQRNIVRRVGLRRVRHHRGRVRSRPAPPRRTAQLVLGELRPHRRSQRPRAALVAVLRLHHPRPVPRTGSRRHPPGRLSRRTPPPLLAGPSPLIPHPLQSGCRLQ